MWQCCNVVIVTLHNHLWNVRTNSNNSKHIKCKRFVNRAPSISITLLYCSAVAVQRQTGREGDRRASDSLWSHLLLSLLFRPFWQETGTHQELQLHWAINDTFSGYHFIKLTYLPVTQLQHGTDTFYFHTYSVDCSSIYIPIKPPWSLHIYKLQITIYIMKIISYIYPMTDWLTLS